MGSISRPLTLHTVWLKEGIYYYVVEDNFFFLNLSARNSDNLYKYIWLRLIACKDFMDLWLNHIIRITDNILLLCSLLSTTAIDVKKNLWWSALSQKKRIVVTIWEVVHVQCKLNFFPEGTQFLFTPYYDY